MATVDKTVDKPVGKCVILRCHQLIMSGACSMTSRHELCSGYCLVETWDSCKLSPECMEMGHHSLAQKWLIEPQELTLDEPADVSREVPQESAPSEVEPVGRPKRKVVPPPRLLEEM